MPINLVVPLIETQIEAAAQVLALALQDDPLFVYILPDAQERRQRLPGFFVPDVRYGYLFGEVFTNSGNPEGVAVWQLPGMDVTPERAKKAGYPQKRAIGMDALQRLGQIFDYLGDFHHHTLPSEHWYLNAIGVVPTDKGRGLAKRYCTLCWNERMLLAYHVA
jgi:ribosomal protein S18 acetylase RimI-like enzyme